MIFALILFCFLVPRALSQLSLEFNTTSYHPGPGETTTIQVSNFPVVWWAPNNTSPPSILLTQAWVVSPLSSRPGYRPTRIRVDFDKCHLGTSNKLVIFPFSYPSFQINITDQFQNLPSYIGAVNTESFNASNMTSLVVNGSEAFIAFKVCFFVFFPFSRHRCTFFPLILNKQCCISATVDANGNIAVSQENITCRMNVTSLPGEEMIPSLRLLFGIIMVFAIPGIAVTMALCFIRPTGDEKRRDAGFQKRSGKWQHACFWPSFLTALIIFIVAFLAKMY